MLTTLPCTRQRTARSFRARISASCNSILSVPSIISVVNVLRDRWLGRAGPPPSRSAGAPDRGWKGRDLSACQVGSTRHLEPTIRKTTYGELRAYQITAGLERAPPPRVHRINADGSAHDRDRHVHHAVEA